MIIGVTGLNGAGKDTVADYLVTKSFYHISLSDIIRDEARKRKAPLSRDSLIRIGNELRQRFGIGVLAERALERMQSDKHYVVTSLRHPGEVEALKKRPDFLLVKVVAPSRVRYERVSVRSGRDDGVSTFDDFVQKEKEEQSSDFYKQQLHKVTTMARVTIDNSGSVEELYPKVDRFLQDWVKKLQPKRPSWDEYFMHIAKVVSSRSNCIKRKIAAIVVKDLRIISTGYNGTPRGVKNCNEGGCARCNSFTTSGTKLDECTCSHGEENAIVQASYHGVSLKNSTLYTTFSPCLTCAKMIINAGIQEVVYNVDYPLTETAAAMLRGAGVEVRQFKIE